MKKITFVLITVFYPIFVFGQYFTSLEEALKLPKEVIHLKLKRQKIIDFPLEILNFTNLKILDLSNNRLITLPDDIENLEHLEELILNKNKITRLPNTIGNISTLRKIDLWSNEIDILPVSIHSLSNLKILDLRGILISKNKQEAIKKILPSTKIHFDRPCNCN